MDVRAQGDRFRLLVRSAFADLFDQRRPFGRLALTHVLMTAGDTLFAISLAGSLFFSISPTAAKDKVLLYLFLTMGPFAVVAPALGPLIDRSRGARRAMVVMSAVGRCILCPLVARDIHSLLLFPEAFVMLVLSKVYLVTRGALVPEMAELELHGGDESGGADIIVLPVRDRSDPTPPYGTPTVHQVDPALGHDVVEPDLATLNARLGLLASLSGFAFAIPGIAVLKLIGAPAVLWVAFAVFVGAAIAGFRLPVPHRRRVRHDRRRRHREDRESWGSNPLAESPAVVTAPVEDPDPVWQADQRDLAALRPLASPTVRLALMPMSVLKVTLGFLTFLYAFGLRRANAATWWFGLLVGALTVGAIVGVLIVGRLRKFLSEEQMLTVALWAVAAAGLLGWLLAARGFQALVALVVGAAGAVAKPSFDALVQTGVAERDQGRAFARFETRLQFMWVIGSLVGVVLSLAIPAGNLVMALLSLGGALAYMSARYRETQHRQTQHRGA